MAKICKAHLGGLVRAGAMVAALAIAGGDVAAQSASEVTPDSFQPPQIKLQGAVVFTGEPGVQAPPGSENLSIAIAGVDLQGGLPQLSEANAAYASRLTRGRIAVSEIFDATIDLEAAYARAGFVLVRIVLPVQRLNDGGSLRVVVVDGFVEDVDTAAVPPEVEGRLGNVTDDLVDKPGLTLRELERALLIAGDTPGVALGSALAAGQRPGGTIIALDPEFRRVTGFVGFDNLVSDTLGEIILNTGVEFNSPFGLGESIYVRASGYPSGFFTSQPQLRTLAGGFALPLGTNGLTFNLELTDSRTAPDDPTTPTTSKFQRTSFRLFYPWIRSRQLNVSSQLSLDLLDDRQDLNVGGVSTGVYHDQLTILRFGTNVAVQAKNGGSFQGGVVLNQGLDTLGARSAADVGTGTPLSRQGADAKFTKLVAAGTYQRPIGERLGLMVTGRWQTSFGDPLATSEQFTIAGPNELSAFDSGGLRGDSGWLLRSELSFRQNASIGGQPFVVSPYIFAAAGSVKLEQPTAVEASRVDALSYGIGVDLFAVTNSNFRSSSLRIEYGRGERDDNVPDEGRLTIFGTYRF